MIDCAPMQSIALNPVRRTARAGGGVTWGAFDAATQTHGLATTGGVIPSTGIAGLTLGGGIGFLMRHFGLSCDNLLAAKLVTAAGEMLNAGETENTELFWGLRGGGGNFGVVTSFTYRLHPVGPTVLGGMLVYPLTAAPAIARFYREFTATAPDEVTTYLNFGSAPDGQPVVALIDRFAARPSPSLHLNSEHLGGAVGRVDAGATAFGDRAAAYTLIVTGSWTGPAESASNIRWIRETWDALQPYAKASVYVNYTDSGDEGRTEAVYGANYARLAALKAKYDPDNVFRSNQNILPAR